MNPVPKEISRLRATDFYRFLQCPHWPYWERFGDPADRRPLTLAEEERLADGLEHEKRIVHDLFLTAEDVETNSPEEGAKKTLELMKQGVPAIYQGWLLHDDWVGRPDLLERQPGKSAFGDWYYVPVDIKRAVHLKKEHKAQLTFYALILEKLQGIFPGHPAVINSDGERIAFDAEEFLPQFQALLDELNKIRQGEMPPPVYRKSCEDTSPWGKRCRQIAEQQHDIALLFNIDVRKLKALRELGIHSFEDAANIDVDALEGKMPGLTRRALDSAKRQATSLRDKSVIIHTPFKDKTRGLEIHFDIESHPPTDVDYLYGFWIGDYHSGTYQRFVAETPEDERNMWRAFLSWTETLPEEYTVYHYAAYELQRLRQLAERYGDEAHPGFKRFVNALQDVKDIIRASCVFPIYFYSLKSIAKFLGASWGSDVKGGGESVIAFDRWLETKDRAILEDIIVYNKDDVRATAFLINWLRTYGISQTVYKPPYPWR